MVTTKEQERSGREKELIINIFIFVISSDWKELVELREVFKKEKKNGG